MKILIAIPCYDKAEVEFDQSLLRLPKNNCEVAYATSSLIYDARNALAEKAINENFDYVMWLDSDMVFKPDVIDRLMAHKKEFVCGVYTTRKAPIKLTLFDLVQPGAFHAIEWCPNELFEIKGCGFGCVLMSTSLLKQVGEAFGRPFSPIVGMGEDLSFCYRVTALGKKMYCDGTIALGHVGKFIYEVTDEFR